MATTGSSSRSNNAVELKESRYVQGGTTDRYPTRLGWWERKKIEKRDNDLRVVVRTNEDRRPDLMAARIYGNARLQWLVLQYNNIVDIQTEFLPGMELRLPTQRRVTLDIMTAPTGGNRVT